MEPRISLNSSTIKIASASAQVARIMLENRPLPWKGKNGQTLIEYTLNHVGSESRTVEVDILSQDSSSSISPWPLHHSTVTAPCAASPGSSASAMALSVVSPLAQGPPRVADGRPGGRPAPDPATTESPPPAPGAEIAAAAPCRAVGVGRGAATP